MRMRPEADYWPKLKAARALGVAPARLDRLAAAGGIRVRRLPLCPPRYSAEDIERLLRESTAVPAAG